jgi:AbiU2
MLVTDPETEFEEELQAFDSDVDVAIQCFYTWQTVHAAARQSRKTYDLLNRNAGFWVMALGSIQANSLIALGRIFDTDKRTHNVGRLLQLAEANVSIFSKAAVVARRENRQRGELFLFHEESGKKLGMDVTFSVFPDGKLGNLPSVPDFSLVLGLV